jgi:hypothetical protein
MKTKINNMDDLKGYRFIGDEMEALGNRLDQARRARKNSKTKWSRQYWNTVIDRLVAQWRRLPVLHDGDVRGTDITRWQIHYNFFEKHDIGMDYGSRVIRNILARPDLEATWHREIERRLLRTY